MCYQKGLKSKPGRSCPWEGHLMVLSIELLQDFLKTTLVLISTGKQKAGSLENCLLHF